jgi:hypothetical protein
MRAALVAGALVVLPGAWFIAQGEALRWFLEGEPPRILRPGVERLRRLYRRIRPPREPQQLPPVLLCLELRRIEAEIRRVEQSDAPHRAMRLRAVLAAYDQVLIQLCERLDVPTDVGMPPLHSGERLALEAELVAAGQDW